MSTKQEYMLFSSLYLLSFAVLTCWLVLLLIGLLSSDVMAFFNRIALPTLLGSVICLELFKRLARNAERKLG